MSASERPSDASVARAVELARLAPDDARRAELAQQCARILDAFRSLSELDVAGVEALHTPLEARDVLRDDRVRPSLPRERLLDNAPRTTGEFFEVPKTIGGAS